MKSYRMKSGRKKNRAEPIPNETTMRPALKVLFAGIFTSIGYYLGIQHALLFYGNQLSSVASVDPSLPPLELLSGSKSRHNITKSQNLAPIDSNSAVFRLHEHVHLSEDPDLYRKLVHPPVRKLLEEGEVKGCPKDPVKPYLDILKNIDKNPSFYEDSSIKNNKSDCPVVFLFYFEGGSKVARTFFEFYSNIETKRCLNFIVSSRWKDHEETKEIVKSHGYTIVGAHYPRQDKTISMSLDKIKKQYGDDVLVSVNDLDHLLVWFDEKSKPHRYSSYTDMVRLYAYELLSTEGCSDQNVHEKYVAPCTCLMEDNKKYVSTIEKNGVVWSEYGFTNRFHPTANFFLDRTNESKEEKKNSQYAYSIGTVFANLRRYERDIITHHKIGYKSKKQFSRAKMAGVIHARSDNMIQSLAKYQHFLQAASLNHFRDNEITIGDAMGCAVVDTRGILRNERTCRKVKEFANILAIGHQKLACLNAGYSDEHCISDMTCCLTY
ncbi:unnamed protein product [Pseudo-nitzschia multistriata]|uniref:Uncharacterized protein n=1 Tax=Pseudo-nitzschia multistriata TaxID=183589 RepID=A0A448ZFZ7_9STRA|nr:unnamed protein product [Pseudo-nitzschia multistriata]